MNVKLEVLAFRIYQYAHPKGWDCLMSDVADALNVSLSSVRYVSTVKGWNSRFRVARADTTAHFGSFNFKNAHDEEVNRFVDRADNDDRG